MNYTNMKNDLRYERKFYSNDLSILQIQDYFLTHPASFKIAYPDRHINNVYYDTNDFNMYRHGVEGDSNRVKVRMRWYGDLFNIDITPTLELKRKFGHVGDKMKWKLSTFMTTDAMLSAAQKVDSLLDNSVNNYSTINTVLPLVRPVLINRYERKYLISADQKYRVTIDQGMCYFTNSINKSSFEKPEKIDGVVVEVKYLPIDHDGVSIITNQIPIRLSKFSKYLNGVEALFKSNRLFV
jgi:SPX domain protein involved in polyphosphate accumulation